MPSCAPWKIVGRKHLHFRTKSHHLWDYGSARDPQKWRSLGSTYDAPPLMNFDVLDKSALAQTLGKQTL
jgi:hypothetical protein